MLSLPFRGPICFEDRETVDHRLIKARTLRWSFPILVRAITEQGSVDVGLIHTIDRRDDGALIAHGLVDGGIVRPGEHPCGIEVVMGRLVAADDDAIVVRHAKIRGLAIYLDGSTPAWPDARIAVGEAMPV